jgi:hypothetical protein
VALHVAQLVADLRHAEILVRLHGLAALERDDFEAGFGELFGEDAARPAEAYDDCVDFLEFGRHGAPPGCTLALKATPTLIPTLP